MNKWTLYIHPVPPVQVLKDCGNRNTRQQEDKDRVGLSHGDEAEATECGFSGIRWQGPQNGLSHWVSAHRPYGRQKVTLVPNGRNTPIADEMPRPSSRHTHKKQVLQSIDEEKELEPTAAGPAITVLSVKTKKDNITPTKKKDWVVILRHMDLLGLMPYCVAGKRTAVGKQQQRYAIANAPWHTTTVNMSKVIQDFEKYSLLEVAEIELGDVITAKGESVQLLKLHVKRTDAHWR